MTAESGTRRLTWYTKPNCGLCEAAWPHVAAASRALRIEVRAVDVTGDEELQTSYGARLPVLACGERVLAEGRISRGAAWWAVVRGRLGPS